MQRLWRSVLDTQSSHVRDFCSFSFVDTMPGGFLFYYWLVTAAPAWIFPHITAAVQVQYCGDNVCVQEKKLVPADLLFEWSKDSGLLRKFATWIGQECHRLSQKQNTLAFQSSFDLKLGGTRRRALQEASISMRYYDLDYIVLLV